MTLIVNRIAGSEPQTATLDLERWAGSLPAPPGQRPVPRRDHSPLWIERSWISEDDEVAPIARWAVSVASAAGCLNVDVAPLDVDSGGYDFGLTCRMLAGDRRRLMSIDTVISDGHRRTRVAVLG